MSFQDAAESPIVMGNLTFPKLTIRTTAKLAAVYQARQTKLLRDLTEGEKMLPENKARFLAMSVTVDYGQGHIWDWSTTLEGSMSICVASLEQAGKSKEDAAALVDVLSPVSVQNVAMEICEHPNAPSKRVVEATPGNPQ